MAEPTGFEPATSDVTVENTECRIGQVYPLRGDYWPTY